MALRGYQALVKVESTPIAFTDEATTTGDNIVYTITNTGKSLWDVDTTLVVEDGGVPTTENFTISYLNGTVTFESADAGRVITVTGAYVTTTTVAEAKSFGFSGFADALDATRFQDSFRQFQAGQITATAELGKFSEFDSMFVDQLLNGKRKLIEYFVDATHAIRFYGVVTTATNEAPFDGLIEESISFQVSTEFGAVTV